MLRADSFTLQAAVGDDHSDGGIRPARLDDLPALLELEQHFPGDRLSRRSLRRLIGPGPSEVMAYEAEARVVGNIVILYRHNSTRARLYSLIVHPDHQGRGIATALLNAAEQAALRRGCDVLSLEVRNDNGAALRLYQRLGYNVIARLQNYYDDRCPALRLEKKVTSSRK